MTQRTSALLALALLPLLACDSPDEPDVPCSPVAEVCNGTDDDCDGAVDEELGSLACGQGACAQSVVACAEGVEGVCTPGAPAAEACDGSVDEDCDGSVDEGCACTDGESRACFTGPPGTAGVGPCQAGSQACAGGTWGACDGQVVPAAEVCNGLDDDCDGTADEGNPGGGAACTPPAGSCAGTLQCSDGALVCQASPAVPDVCDGADNDCDPSTADGSGDGRLGSPCDGADADLCQEGTLACGPAGAVICSDETAATVELCNGVDDDCDPSTADGAADPALSASCDGGDGDLCAEGVNVCQGGALVCTDGSGDSRDLCNGADDDCDPASPDGSEDGRVGATCDGPDGDLCQEGALACGPAGIVCSDATSTTADVCNGLDDDCNPTTADGAGDPMAGAACDGADGDLCAEGAFTCQGGALVCSDASGDTPDVCNGQDDDCDPSSADGSEHVGIGGACDGPDADLCLEGVVACTDGGMVCTDQTGASLEVCGNGIDDDCDGTVDGGCTP